MDMAGSLDSLQSSLGFVFRRTGWSCISVTERLWDVGVCSLLSTCFWLIVRPQKEALVFWWSYVFLYQTTEVQCSSWISTLTCCVETEISVCFISTMSTLLEVFIKWCTMLQELPLWQQPRHVKGESLDYSSWWNTSMKGTRGFKRLKVHPGWFGIWLNRVWHAADLWPL